MESAASFLKLVGPGVFEGRDHRGVFWRIKHSEEKWEIFYGSDPDAQLAQGEYSPMSSLSDARDSIELQIRFETDPVFRQLRKDRDSQKKKERRLARQRMRYRG